MPKDSKHISRNYFWAEDYQYTYIIYICIYIYTYVNGTCSELFGAAGIDNKLPQRTVQVSKGSEV